MNRLKWVNKMSIPLYYQVICLFIVVLIPLYITGYFLTSRSQEVIVEQINDSTLKKAEYYLNSLKQSYISIQQLEYDCMYDVDFSKYVLKEFITNDYDVYALYLRIWKLISIMSRSSDLIENVEVHFPSVNKTISSVSGAASLSKEYSIYESLTTESRANGLHYIDGIAYLIASYPITWQEHGTPMFVITAKLSSQSLLSYLKNTLQSDDNIAILTNESGWYLYSSGKNPSADQLHMIMDKAAVQESGFSSIKLNSENYLATWQSLGDYGLKMIILNNLTRVNRPVEQFRFFFTFFSILLLVLAILYASLILRLVKKPIDLLVHAFSKMKDGNFNHRLQIQPKNEFGYLYASYNEMAETINHLIHEVYEAKLLAQHSELKHLQTQINPHFLYNCFFLLNGQIQIGDTGTAAEMASKLGRYFQFITKNGQDEIPLSLEYMHAITYIDIQRLRFGNRIEIRYSEFPREIEGFMVPRLIIQPLVENAFEHGICYMPRGGIISLSVSFLDGLITISVEDNGDRLTDVEISDLACRNIADKGFTESTALENINRRLQILFGSAGCLTASRSTLGGLNVSIVINTRKEG